MRSRRPASVAGAAAALMLLAVQVAGCAPLSNASQCPASDCSASGPPSASASALPATVPRGFPLIEGAIAVPNPDGDAIAAWRVNSVGSAAFDFYTRALRRAGFIVLGEFPSERSAMIRFQAPDGPILQVVAELSNGETLLTLRPDRP